MRRARVVTAVVVVLAGWVATPVALAAPTPEPGAPGAVPDTRPGTAFADPRVAQLQVTATEVQHELAGLATQIHTAETDLGKATATANAARDRRKQADAVVAARQGEMDRYAVAVFGAMGQPNSMQALFSAASPEDFLDGADLLGELRRQAEQRLTAAMQRQRSATAAEQQASQAEQLAAQRKNALDRRTADATNRAAAVSSELRGQVAAADNAVIAMQRAQAQRNADTKANWQAYLDRLHAAGITPPPAGALRDPAHLPGGLTRLGAPGVAQTSAHGQTLLVLPKETIDAVSAAMGTLGKPYVPHKSGGGPVAYSCDGLVHTVYGGAGLSLPPSVGEQFAQLAPVATADVQPGDLAFLGPRQYGVQGVGIVLDQHTMLAADGRLAGVVVTDLPGPDTVLGFARPALAHRPAQPVPAATDRGLTWRCGGVQLPPSPSGQTSGAWGGYPNGLIPATALCPIGIGAHVLRCDAAESFKAMSQAYQAVSGRPLCVTDSYRTFDQQVKLYAQKPALAAVPGTSNHGWGLAVDMCGGVEHWGTPEHAWMVANAGAFGWTNPGWAQPGRGREEPWHWEFS
ncbi:D-alanyl-D-alanine carboxypeptidase family protein [Labedaea rhizosphaerae]|uniref:NlpC/P60 family protein n=1 Tax=Labedaea rhizosphaerae TaxID=598644 RepID=A0A4R6S8C1_LABRH|nr:D-alanyl-D-alanine carboxypeptidase family protein [Labedaea rhizosphaerae]TDP96080.1 NlpC/P60 family protein [Labedaea rhizosphaerae]